MILRNGSTGMTALSSTGNLDRPPLELTRLSHRIFPPVISDLLRFLEGQGSQSPSLLLLTLSPIAGTLGIG